MIRIIDNKKIDLTDDEFTLYQNICKAYDRQYFKGESLFQDLFETDATGKIVFLKPPQVFTSMEVVIFLSNIMVQQHLRYSCEQSAKVTKEAKEIIAELKKLMKELKSE